MTDMNSIIDLDAIAEQALATIDGYKQDISRVDAEMRQANQRLQRYMANHDLVMKGLKAERRQCVTNLAEFRESVGDELASIEAAMIQRRNERKGISAQVASSDSPN
jgi:septal ring factor EnvC (AmiA/AmiB activator)